MAECGEAPVTKRAGAATNAEVARRAGVSPATVSRVMNGRFGGAPEVADRVRATAAELGYSPNGLARALALGRTQAIAFVVPDLANPAFQQILSGLSKAAAVEGHRVLVADSAEVADDEPLLALETRRRCDALVLCAPRMSEERLADLIQSVHPLVLVNRSMPEAKVPSLSIDYGSGMNNLASHLHGLGHRRIAYLAGTGNSVSNRRRLRGLDVFSATHPDVEVLRLGCGVTSEDGRRVADDVIATGVTAVIAFNDLVAIGLVHRLGELGVDVPGELSVTGFDDIPFARYNVPPLTTASVPYELLGAESWRRLHALLRGETPDYDVTYQPRLVLRNSTGPVPGGGRTGSRQR